MSTEEASNSTNPDDPKKQRPRARTPFGSGRRRREMKWRSARSKRPFADPADEPLKDVPYADFGGTRAWPAKGGDPAKVTALALPQVENVEDSAELLSLSVGTLLQTIIGTIGCGNYILRLLRKARGGFRPLMIPLKRLKEVQRRLLRGLLDKLPMHENAHGFRQGHGILTNARPHVGKRVVICMDIKDFFPSFDHRRVAGYFRSVGYKRGIANNFARLTLATPDQCRVRGRKRHPWGTRRKFRRMLQILGWIGKTRAENEKLRRRSMLPQGAPTSPGLANAISARMDRRLSALAAGFGGNYTRYADDLTFSGGHKMANGAKRFVEKIGIIIRSEGFEVNTKKTRIMRKGRRQKVTGVVVNKQTNLSRRDFELLKAILHNCIKKGPSTQNHSSHPSFKDHLRGRVAHALHIGPERGAKLKKLFDAIDWSR